MAARSKHRAGGPPYLREWRQHAKITLVELARRLGTTQASLSRYETRQRPITTGILDAIASETTPDGELTSLFVKPEEWREDVAAFAAELDRLARDDDGTNIMYLWRQMDGRQRLLLLDIAYAIIKTKI
jgi:transcriptional regulator with XRE-family HTH domain